MEGDIMQIIDATLSMLNHTPPTKEQASEFVRLMLACGIKDYMISKEIYPEIEELLPSEVNYYMEVNALDDRTQYKKITYYLENKVVEKGTISLIL